MSNYIVPSVETDPSILLQRVYEYLRANVPNWTPSAGQLDVWLAQAFVSAVAEARDTASTVPTSIFRYFGATLVGVQPIDATRATGLVTFTAIDAAGYSIPAGTQLGIYIDGANVWPFATLTDAEILPGTDHVDNVQIQATLAGKNGSELGIAGATVLLLDPIEYIASVTLAGPTSGGVDAESDDDYLDRLVAELQLLAPRPILPNDFAVMARNIAGVYRAAAIDGYDPLLQTYSNERMVAVAVTDIAGAALSAGVKTEVKDYLESLREVNFVVNVIDPTFNPIQVVYTVKALPEADPNTVKTAVDNALKGYISPATWGASELSALQWTPNTLLRFNKIVQLVDNVAGVDYIVSLLAGPAPGALTTNDISLTGAAPLPTLADVNISGTVT